MTNYICPQYQECKHKAYFSNCLTQYEECEYFDTQNERDIWTDQDLGLTKLVNSSSIVNTK